MATKTRPDPVAPNDATTLPIAYVADEEDISLIAQATIRITSWSAANPDLAYNGALDKLALDAVAFGLTSVPYVYQISPYYNPADGEHVCAIYWCASYGSLQGKIAK